MPNFDLLKHFPPKKILSAFRRILDKLKTNTDDLQKEKFSAKTIRTTLEQQKNVRSRAENHWGALGHNVASSAAVWNSCYDSPSLGRENNISFLISYRMYLKTGMYFTYTWNMTMVNEFCTICNT